MFLVPGDCTVYLNPSKLRPFFYRGGKYVCLKVDISILIICDTSDITGYSRRRSGLLVHHFT